MVRNRREWAREMEEVTALHIILGLEEFNDWQAKQVRLREDGIYEVSGESEATHPPTSLPSSDFAGYTSQNLSRFNFS